MDTGYQGFQRLRETGIMFGWLKHRSESVGSQTHIRSQDFARNQLCAASLAIPKHASLIWCAAQKNDLRVLWTSAIGLVRPAHAASTRPVLRRPARLLATRRTAGGLQALRQSETRATRLPGRQPVLHQALCPLCRTALPVCVDQGCRRVIEPALGNRQDAGEAIHASAVDQGGHAVILPACLPACPFAVECRIL